MGYRSLPRHILNFGTRWTLVVNLKFRMVYPRGESPRYPSNGTLDGPQGQCECCGEDEYACPCRESNHRCPAHNQSPKNWLRYPGSFNTHTNTSKSIANTSDIIMLRPLSKKLAISVLTFHSLQFSKPFQLSEYINGLNSFAVTSYFEPNSVGLLEQWYSTWGTRRNFRGYVKFKKRKYYFMINTE
jgi:hypothetical protein